MLTSPSIFGGRSTFIKYLETIALEEVPLPLSKEPEANFDSVDVERLSGVLLAVHPKMEPLCLQLKSILQVERSQTGGLSVPLLQGEEKFPKGSPHVKPMQPVTKLFTEKIICYCINQGYWLDPGKMLLSVSGEAEYQRKFEFASFLLSTCLSEGITVVACADQMY